MELRISKSSWAYKYFAAMRLEDSETACWVIEA
jgi:hypothetical protein